jgi:hypothetical protein
MWPLRTTILLTVFHLLQSSLADSSVDIVLNQYEYCIKYYGTVQAEIELPSESIPTYNYNGTILCPLDIYTPYIAGATLNICPPYSSYPSDNLALQATLELRTAGYELSGAIDSLSLSPTLITNGSVPPSFFDVPNNIPAVLQKDIHESRQFLPVWTVNGTSAALTDYTDATDDTQGVYISCDYGSFNQYCGGYEDLHDAATGGCWRSQTIPFNMQSNLNYTFRFSASEASVDIWTEDEYVTYLGNRTGTNTKVYLRFGGTRQLPSVVDYDFWENSNSNYEVETAYIEKSTTLKFEEDEEGLPLFMNQTETGEWFDTANGTYSTQDINGRASAMRSNIGVVGVVVLIVLWFGGS